MAASTSSGEPKSNTSIEDLPNEILEHIIGLLPPYIDYKNCSLVNKKWNKNVKNVIKRKKVQFSLAIRNYNIRWENTDNLVQAHMITRRYSHTACVFENSMFVYGGFTATSTTFDDLWKLDLTTRRWQRMMTMGTHPSPKACASLVHHRRNLVLFGGWSYPLYTRNQAWRTFNELHVYDIDENYWNRMNNLSHYPPSMAGHSATVHRDCMIIFGGLQNYRIGSNDLWCLNLVTHIWTKKETTEIKPHPRYGHSQVAIDDDHLLILGGWGEKPIKINEDVWILNMVGRVWVWNRVIIQNQSANSHLWCHPACRVDDYVIMLSRNPESNPTALDYSSWTTNTKIRISLRRLAPHPPGNPYRPPAANAGPSRDREQPGNNTPPNMVMFVLDISNVLKDGTAEWLPIKFVAPGGPQATILYSLVAANGELIMFGGLRKELAFVRNAREEAENPSDTVSNSLYFITAPQSSI